MGGRGCNVLRGLPLQLYTLAGSAAKKGHLVNTGTELLVTSFRFSNYIQTNSLLDAYKLTMSNPGNSHRTVQYVRTTDIYTGKVAG